MDNPVICQSCKHYKLERYVTVFDNESFHLCKKAKHVDLVTGRVTYELCVDVRSNIDQCGTQGKWYEQS